MDIFEIIGETGYKTGVARDGVNFLEPADSFADIFDGFIHRQVLQSRRGISTFTDRLPSAPLANTRVTGIFEHILPDGTTECLVTDQNYMYKYTSGAFVLIPFAGALAAYAGFGLAANEYYISGTSYPDKNYNPRFVFTSEGMSLSGTSGVFFYDGTDIKDFTDTAADNPDYQAYAGGALNRARHVIWFGERLNFIVPEIAAKRSLQGILFSALRTASGNGDKFNSSGAGLIQLDTAEEIRGASILGQWIAMNLTRSSWTLEKTKDVFNPYYPRKIPSVIGTDAPFSFSQWGGYVLSLGKTGIIKMNNQQSKRTDNSIPYFTRDKIESEEFDQSYGGFDRDTSQFLFSYVANGSDSTTQDKILCYNYEEESFSVYNLSLTVFGQTIVGQDLTWNQIEAANNPSWETWNTTEEIWNKIGVTETVQKTLAGDDAGFVYAFNRDYDDYFEPISAITQASQAVVTVSASNFAEGDLVIIEGVSDMEINNFDPSTGLREGNYYTIVSATATSVTINRDSTNFTAYAAGDGFLSKVISFQAQTNPFNPYRDKGKKCIISTVEFLINTDCETLKVDVYVDGEQSPIIRDVELIPYDLTKSRNWVDLSINHEADFFTIVMSHQSGARGIEITSVRIHAREGGLTSE